MSPVFMSESRNNLWNFCPEAFGLHYFDGWRKNVQSASLSKGSLFHLGVEFHLKKLYASGDSVQLPVTEMMNVFANNQEECVKALTAQAAEWQETAEKNRGMSFSEEEADAMVETLNTVAWMVDHYLEGLATLLHGRLPLAIEHRFEDTFKAGQGFTEVTNVGVIDFILYDPFEDTVYVVDHKSAADLLDATKRMEYSQQTAGYVRYVEAQINEGKEWETPWGSKVTVKPSASIRPMYRIVRNKLPKEPKILKNGTVSAAAVSTIAPIYEQALCNQSEPVSEKQALRLESLPDNWRAVSEPVVNAEDRERWENDMSIQAERMDQARLLPVYRTKNTSNCHVCDKRVLCHMGSDPDFTQLKEEPEKDDNDATTE